MNQSVTTQSQPKPKSNKNFLWVILLILIVLAAGIYYYVNYANKNVPPTTPAQSPKTQDATAIKTVADANNYFGFNLFKQLLSDNESDNLVISPMSISMALTLTANGANGETLSEMQKVLGFSNLDLSKVNLDNKSFLGSLAESNPTPQRSGETRTEPVFNVANSLWADKKFSFLEDFKTLAKDYYQAEARSLDFKDPKSLDIINGWVSEKTNEKIPKILDQLASDLYLINAIYFKASWNDPFKADFTKQENFYLEDGSTKNVPLMTQANSYNYYQENNLQVLSLPYFGGKYTMEIFLPSKGGNIGEFVNGLDWQKYVNYISKQEYKPGQIKIPKYKNEFGQNILEKLQSIGLNIASSDQADFSKMCAIPMEISGVIHKTFIDVDESGTEAAAATAVGMQATSIGDEPPKPFTMVVDHPFFFTIEERESHEVIFMGTVKNP